ncbi:uncharacterized protein [Apostichopus japonicus]|uniref:uncharacterized protein isoform X2 n=1 Tax=Stichopus japonicus TaxID=307972 RepID=UPI003AB4D237
MEVNFKWIAYFLLFLRFVNATIISNLSVDFVNRNSRTRITLQSNNTLKVRQFLTSLPAMLEAEIDGIGTEKYRNAADEMDIKKQLGDKVVQYPHRSSELTSSIGQEHRPSKVTSSIGEAHRSSGLTSSVGETNAKLVKVKDNSVANQTLKRPLDTAMPASVRGSSTNDTILFRLIMSLLAIDDIQLGNQSFLPFYKHLIIDSDKTDVPFANYYKYFRRIFGRKILLTRGGYVADTSTFGNNDRKSNASFQSRLFSRQSLPSTLQKLRQTNVEIFRVSSRLLMDESIEASINRTNKSHGIEMRSLKAEQAKSSIRENDTSNKNESSNTLYHSHRQLRLGEEPSVGNKVIYPIRLPSNSQDQGHLMRKWVGERLRMDNKRKVKRLFENEDKKTDKDTVFDGKVQLHRQAVNRTEKAHHGDEGVVKMTLKDAEDVIGEITPPQTVSPDKVLSKDDASPNVDIKYDEKLVIHQTEEDTEGRATGASFQIVNRNRAIRTSLNYRSRKLMIVKGKMKTKTRSELLNPERPTVTNSRRKLSKVGLKRPKTSKGFSKRKNFQNRLRSGKDRTMFVNGVGVLGNLTEGRILISTQREDYKLSNSHQRSFRSNEDHNVTITDDDVIVANDNQTKKSFNQPNTLSNLENMMEMNISDENSKILKFQRYLPSGRTEEVGQLQNNRVIRRKRRDLNDPSTQPPETTFLENVTANTVVIDTVTNQSMETDMMMVSDDKFTQREKTTTIGEYLLPDTTTDDTVSSGGSNKFGPPFNILISVQSNSSILYIMPSFMLLTLLGLIVAGVRRWLAIKRAHSRDQLLPPARGKDGEYSMDNPLAIDIDAPSTSKGLPGTSSDNSGSPENDGGLFTVSKSGGSPPFNTFPHRSRRMTQDRSSSFDSSRQCCCSWCLIQNNDVQTTRL